MHVEIPEVKRCFCCIPARYGLLIWMYIRLMISILAMTPLIALLVIFGSALAEGPHFAIGILGTLGLGLDVSMNIVALVGAHTKKLKLLHVYYKYSIFSLLLFIIIYMLIISSELYVIGVYNWPPFYVWRYLMPYLVVGFSSVVLQIYMLLLLRSKVHKLKSNCQFRFVNNAAVAEVECAMHIDRSFVCKCSDDGTEEDIWEHEESNEANYSEEYYA